MRKVLLCLLGLLFVSGTKLYAYDFHSGGIYYNILDGNKVEVTSGDSKYEGYIVITEIVTYNGKSYNVTSIGSRAFKNCSGLTSITIPSSVTSIGDAAFYDCSGLTSVTIPNSVMSIGNDSFSGCSGLTSITISNSVMSIGDRVFYYCKGLTSITLPSSVTSIGSSAFYYCSGLTSVTIPNSVTSIGDHAFSICKGLTSITLPNSVTSIGSDAFSACIGLTSITIPNSVTSIGERAFQDCSSLTNITIPSSVTSISNHTFRKCSGLTSITIPNSVKSIGENAFEDCSSLTNITIPNSVTSISNCAFWGCSALISIILPNSVSSISSYAFYNCSGLSSVTIPSSVTNIGCYAFSGCKGLTSITFPNSLTSISNYAFKDCSGLTSIVSEIVKPFEIQSNVFSYYTKPTLTVPSGTKSAYQSTAGWNKFTNIVEGNLENQYKSLDDYIKVSSVKRNGNIYDINPIIKNIKKIYVDLRENTTSGSYCFMGIHNDSENNNIDISSRGLNNNSSHNLTIKNSSYYNIKKLADNKTYSWLYYNPSNNNEVIIDVEQYLGGVGHIKNWQYTFGTSCVVNIVTDSSENSGMAEPIDLGLSVKWASWNIGASKPEEYGSYFSWGETSPKSNYAWSTYKYGNPPSKYNSTDNKKTLDPSDDAAVVLWGGKWRMPTNAEEKELYEKCKWTYTQRNGINGYQVTGPNGNSIFLPSAGLYDANSTLSSKNSGGWYWSSTSLNNQYACGLYFLSYTVSYSIASHDKCDGHVIRPVYGESSQSQNIVITAKSYTREYGDDNPSFEYTVSGGSISGTPKITCSATKTSAVGTYTIKIEEGNVTNSNVTFVDGTLTITKAPLTITAKSYTRKQGETNPTFDVTYSGFKNNETASVLTQKPTCFTTATSSSSPGTYDITVSGASATNYDISYVNGKLTVTQADAVIVTAVSYTREYGEDNPKFSYTTNGAALNGTPSITCSATKTSPVGTYPIKIVQGSVSNYNVTYVDGTLTITKAPLTITAKSYTRKQGESNPTFDVTYSGFKNGENASVLSRQPTCITTAVSSSPPGTYDIIVSGASATNYDISYVKGMLTVTQADAVIVTAKSYTREYGEENPVFDYTTSGGSLNGTPTIICSATRTSPVGTYPIKITQGSGRNYNVTYVDGTLTITKAPLIITAKSYKREEGTANPTLEATYSGFKNGETESVLSKKPTLTTTATIDSKPGDYPITASGAEARNYQISYMSGKLTVTEKNEVKFTSQGVSYIGTNATRTAEIEVVASDITELEIPQSVINDGKTYQVTSVSNGALSNRKFNYVSLPSTITSLNANTFYNSVLGALVWKADASLSSNVFSYMAMPTLSNFLLYVNSKSYAPSNVTNVVVGNTASNIVLADGTNTWFYCPMAFTAQSVTYTHHYGMLTGGYGKGWETISLPYDVHKIEHKSKGMLTPFVLYNDMMTQRPFWLYEFGSNGFSKTDVIKANTPYIIAMPNDSKYDEEYILVGDVTFSATNAQIHKTESLVMPSSNGKTFVPAFTVVDSSSSVYALNVNNNMASYAGSYEAGSRFISNLRDVYPFEAYMTTSSSSARTLGIDFADGTTGIDEIPMAGNGERVKVYSLSGLLLIDSEQSEWESLWQQLPSGVYIVNGKKTIK